MPTARNVGGFPTSEKLNENNYLWLAVDAVRGQLFSVFPVIGFFRGRNSAQEQAILRVTLACTEVFGAGR